MGKQYADFWDHEGNCPPEKRTRDWAQSGGGPKAAEVETMEPYQYIQFPEYMGTIPLETEFFDMLTTKQAKEYLEWYKSEVPKRFLYLISYCAQEMKIPKSELLKFPEGCIPLWKWFQTKLTMRPTTQEEQEQMRREFGFLGEWHVLKKIVTEEARSIAYDISMYFGYQLISHYPNDLEWGYVLKPKDIVYLKSPVITGFSKYYNARGNLCKSSISPSQVVGKQWCKIYHADLRMKDDDFYQSAIAIMNMVKTVEGTVVPPVEPVWSDLEKG